MRNGKNRASELAALYETWSTKELMHAVTVDSSGYTPEAMSLMQAELERRGVPAEERDQLRLQVAARHEKEERSLTGVAGWLVVFVIIFSLNFLQILAVSTATLILPVLPLIKLHAMLEGVIAMYALLVLWWLLSRDERAPRHAKAVLVAFCLLTIGAWLFYHQRADFQPGFFPVGVVGFTCFWWSYLSYSKRVRLTYEARTVSEQP